MFFGLHTPQLCAQAILVLFWPTWALFLRYILAFMMKSPGHRTQTHLQLHETHAQATATDLATLLRPGVWSLCLCPQMPAWSATLSSSLSGCGQHSLLKTPHWETSAVFTTFCRGYFRFFKKLFYHFKILNMPSVLHRNRFQRSDISSVLYVECVLLSFLSVFFNPTHTQKK